MRIVLSVASMSANAGGPSRSVPALGRALSSQGISTVIVSCKSPVTDDDAFIDHGLETRLADCDRHRSFRLSARSFRHELRNCLERERAQLLHDNGIWLPTNHAAAHYARQMGLPFVVSPRGMLEPWALRFRAWKKRLAWLLYQERDLRNAVVLHATSDMEGRQFRSIGLRQPIAVIPNGVDLPPLSKSKNSADTSADRTALFLSRIHPKKGLLDLVAAWAALRPSGWRLVIAGPDEGGHRQDIETAVALAGLTGVISFSGPVEGSRKQQLFATADLFVLPTYSENFGIAIAEALAAGLPVITTKGTPWSELESRGCGWWTGIGVTPLIDALRVATTISDAERRTMGARGRDLVSERYSWARIAAEMRRVYEWLVHAGGIPACVRVD